MIASRTEPVRVRVSYRERRSGQRAGDTSALRRLGNPEGYTAGSAVGFVSVAGYGMIKVGFRSLVKGV